MRYAWKLNPNRSLSMATLCPIALAVSCQKCPIFKVCPAKGVIGDYKPDSKQDAKPAEKKNS